MKKYAALLVTGVVALGMTACGNGETAKPTPTLSYETPAPKAPATPAPTTEAPKPKSEVRSDGTKPFGATWHYEDGLTITVSEPKPFKPSDTAFIENPETDKDFVVVTVVIKNGSDEVYDSNQFVAKATTGDREASAVFDSEKGVDMPTSKVLPGKSLKFKAAFTADKGQEFIMTVSGDFDAHSNEGMYR